MKQYKPSTPSLVHAAALGRPSPNTSLTSSASGPARAGTTAEEPGWLDHLEQAFGSELSGLDFEFGSSGLAAIGARASAEGDALRFAESAPDLEQVAHEVTHALQVQQHGPGEDRMLSRHEDPAEVEARSVASAVTAGHAAPTIRARPSGRIQRDDDGSDAGSEWEEEWEQEAFEEGGTDVDRDFDDAPSEPVDTSDLEAKLEECKGWFDDNEDGMFMLLKNASNAELAALVEKGVAERWLSELHADQALEIRARMYPEDAAGNVVRRFEDEPWYGYQSGSIDALLALPKAQRAEAYAALEEGGQLAQMDSETQERVRTICLGTEAEALQARLEQATAGAGTDESGVATALTGAAELQAEQRLLLARLEADNLGSEEREEVEARLAEIGDVSALLDGTTDTAFLQLASSEVSRGEMAAALAAGGADQDQIAKQRILAAEGWTDDDQTEMMRAIASVEDPEKRAKLLEDPQVAAALGPAWGGLDDEVVEDLKDGDTYTLAAAELTELCWAVSPDKGAILKRIIQMSPEDRARLQKDASLMGMLTAQKEWLATPGDTSWAETVRAAVATGEMPTDWVLEDATDGLLDDSDLLNDGYAGMSPHDREAVQRAYLLEKRRVPESEWSDEDREAMERYLALSAPIDDLSSAAEQDEARRAMLGQLDPAMMLEPGGRADLVDTLYYRQLERVELEGGPLSSGNADQTLQFAHEAFVAAYQARSSEVTLAEASELVRLDLQFWEAADAQAAANAYAAELASSIAAAAVCVAVAFIPGVGPAAAGSLYSALGANAGLISAAAVLGGIAKVGVGEGVGGDFNDIEEDAPGQFTSGAVEVIAGVVGAHLAQGVVGAVGLAGPKLAGHLAKNAGGAARAGFGRSIATGALEGAVDGAVGGAMGEVVMTAMDAETYKRGVWQVVGRYASAIVEGGILGAATGGAVGGGLSGAGRALEALADLRKVAAPHPDPEPFIATLRESLPPDVAEQLSDGLSVQVLEIDAMTELTRSRSGQAVLHVEGDTVYVFVREGAPASVMREEAVHLEQLLDPELGRKIRNIYDNAPSAQAWMELDLPKQRELYLDKLDVEIDAQRRLSASGSAEERELAEGQLADLLARRDAVRSTPAGELDRQPWWDTEQPPWLFKKAKFSEGERIRHGDNAEVGRHEVDPAGSSIKLEPGEVLNRVGEEWVEGVHIKPNGAGTVDEVTESHVVVRHGDSTTTYPFNTSSEVFASVGDDVDGSTILVTEHRQYRHVEATRADGSVRTARGEIQGLDGRWRQRGSESTRRGQIAEDAANAEIADDLAARKAEGALSDYLVVDPRNGSGGFDGARVEFTGEGDALEARIIVTEVKDYPNRWVPVDEFTAIGDNLDDNLQALGDTLLETEMTAAQRRAVINALRNEDFRVEIRITSATRIGTQGKDAALTQLRARIDGEYGPGTLLDVENVADSYLDDATRKAVEDTP